MVSCLLADMEYDAEVSVAVGQSQHNTGPNFTGRGSLGGKVSEVWT
jgi:hypothetical protein